MFNINFASEKEVEGYEKLQKRINEKNDFLEKVFTSVNDLTKYLNEVYKRILLHNSNFNNLPFSLEEQNIQETCILIFQKISNSIQQDILLLDNIRKNLGLHINTFNKEKSMYNDFKKLNRELLEEKEKLQKNKEIYHKVGKEAENKIKKFVQNNYNMLSNLSNLPEELKKELDNISSPAIRALNNYKNSINKVNQLIDTFNFKQSELFEFLPELGNEDGVFFFRLIKFYLQNLEDGEKYLNSNKRKLNDSKTVETDSKLKELIETNEKNKRDEKPIDLMQYQSGIDFNKCKNQNEFDLSAKSIEIINLKINKEIYPNYSYEQELKNFAEGLLIKEIFNEKELDEKKAKKFLDSLKDESIHRAVFIVLSQLRTNNRFLRSKPLIDLLGKAFEILLQYAEKNKLYEYAKNSIILSQTYFYNDENNKKVYLFEYIKHNKWLSNSHFWRGFIDYMIKNEIERFEKTFPETIFNVEQKINITQKVKDKLNEVIFSQLLPFISNMIDFGIDKRVVLKIAEEFKDKYNYLTPNHLETLYGIISSNKEDIEKFRKEYSSSLEPELKLTAEEDTKKELKENIETKEYSEIKKENEENKESNKIIEESKENTKEKEDKTEKFNDKEEIKETKEDNKNEGTNDNNN